MQSPEEKHVSKTISYSTSGQVIHCYDPEIGKLRESTKRDLENLSRVVNSCEDLGRTHPTFLLQDTSLITRDMHAFVTIVLNSDKPL